jgi:hypothetical protein
MDRILELTTPTGGGGAAAAVTVVAVLRTVTYLSASFSGPLAEDFLRTSMLSE